MQGSILFQNAGGLLRDYAALSDLTFIREILYIMGRMSALCILFKDSEFCRWFCKEDILKRLWNVSTDKWCRGEYNNINTINKTEALMDANEEVGLKVNTENSNMLTYRHPNAWQS
jgi:hypothetical protein